MEKGIADAARSTVEREAEKDSEFCSVDSIGRFPWDS